MTRLLQQTLPFAWRARPFLILARCNSFPSSAVRLVSSEPPSPKKDEPNPTSLVQHQNRLPTKTAGGLPMVLSSGPHEDIGLPTVSAHPDHVGRSPSRSDSRILVFAARFKTTA